MPSINTFKANFPFGGARTSKFMVKINNPSNANADVDIPFLCHAASLPEITLKPLEVAYMGRKIKVAGSKEYADWTVRIYNDEDFKVKNAIESWMNQMNAGEENLNTFGSSNMNNYKSLAEVDQLSQTDTVLRTYKFVGIFPIRMSAIELDWDNENVQSFDVTFAVDYFYVSQSSTGQFALDDLTPPTTG